MWIKQKVMQTEAGETIITLHDGTEILISTAHDESDHRNYLNVEITGNLFDDGLVTLDDVLIADLENGFSRGKASLDTLKKELARVEKLLKKTKNELNAANAKRKKAKKK